MGRTKLRFNCHVAITKNGELYSLKVFKLYFLLLDTNSDFSLLPLRGFLFLNLEPPLFSRCSGLQSASETVFRHRFENTACPGKALRLDIVKLNFTIANKYTKVLARQCFGRYVCQIFVRA
jgi:hypothetical protein